MFDKYVTTDIPRSTKSIMSHIDTVCILDINTEGGVHKTGTSSEYNTYNGS